MICFTVLWKHVISWHRFSTNWSWNNRSMNLQRLVLFLLGTGGCNKELEITRVRQNLSEYRTRWEQGIIHTWNHSLVRVPNNCSLFCRSVSSATSILNSSSLVTMVSLWNTYSLIPNFTQCLDSRLILSNFCKVFCLLIYLEHVCNCAKVTGVEFLWPQPTPGPQSCLPIFMQLWNSNSYGKCVFSTNFVDSLSVAAELRKPRHFFAYLILSIKSSHFINFIYQIRKNHMGRQLILIPSGVVSDARSASQVSFRSNWSPNRTRKKLSNIHWVIKWKNFDFILCVLSNTKLCTSNGNRTNISPDNLVYKDLFVMTKEFLIKWFL